MTFRFDRRLMLRFMGVQLALPLVQVRAHALVGEVDEGVLVAHDGLGGQVVADRLEPRHLLDRGADRQELDDATAKRVNIGFYPNNVICASLHGVLHQSVEGIFAGIVNESSQFFNLTSNKGLKGRSDPSGEPERVDADPKNQF
jgi:hypothetical protein